MLADEQAPQLFHSLYSHHHGWLRGWLRKKLGNAGDAEDLAHDTYVRVLVARTAPPPEQSRRYLAQIANGLAIDLFRRRRIEAAYLDALAAQPDVHVHSEEQRALIVETLVEIDAILHGLPPKVRMALLLCKIDGLPYRDIAERLGVSVSSVEKYIAAGLLACYRAVYDADGK